MVFAESTSSEVRLGFSSYGGRSKTESLDITNSSRATFESKYNWGSLLFLDIRKPNIRYLWEVGVSQLEMAEPEGRSIQNNPVLYYQTHFGLGYHPFSQSKKIWVTLLGGYQQNILISAMDASNFDLKIFSYPTFGFKVNFDFLTGNSLGVEVEWGVEGVPPWNITYDKIRYGYSAMAKLILGMKLAKKLKIDFGGQAEYAGIYLEKAEDMQTQFKGLLNIYFTL